MADGIFDRDTWFNLGGGIIPMGIVLFFLALFLAFDPFGPDPVATFFTVLLLAVPIVTLVVVLFVTGRVISEAEHAGESKTARAMTEFLAGTPPTDDADEE